MRATARLFVRGARSLLDFLPDLMSGAPGCPQRNGGRYDSCRPTPGTGLQLQAFRTRIGQHPGLAAAVFRRGAVLTLAHDCRGRLHRIASPRLDGVTPGRRSVLETLEQDRGQLFYRQLFMLRVLSSVRQIR